MCEADQHRALPMVATLFEGEGAVIEATAHAQAIAFRVKGDERQEDHIERPRHDVLSMPQERFGYAKTVVDQSGSRFKGGEPETVAGTCSEDRQVGALAGLQCQMEQGGGIDFASAGKIEGDTVAVSEGFVVACEAQQSKAVPFEGLSGQSPTLVAHLSAQSR